MEVTGTLIAENYKDPEGRPAGGMAEAIGLRIDWQERPLGAHGENREMPSGAFIGDVLWAVVKRLEFFQKSAFAHKKNQEAIVLIKSAIESLEQRTADRRMRGVEGTHQI